MKKVILFTVVALFSVVVQAKDVATPVESADKYMTHGKNFFTVQGQAFVTPTRVDVRVFNRFNRPVFCQGMAYGQTFQGMMLNSWFSSVIPAFGYGYAYVYSYNPGQRFVRGWGTFNCRFY